jgi:GntR family transcriptional regulator
VRRTPASAAERPPVRPARPAPLHARIREELRERIVSGRWQPDDALPSERDLMAHYGVSRITVRQALGDLQKESLIFKLAGKGAYVSHPRPFQELGRLEGFAEAMAARGHETWNRVLAVRHEPASELVASRLRLPPGAPVTQLRRVRHLDRRPVSLDITWLPRALGERLAREDLATRDVFLILESECATPLGHADLVIDAGLADATLADALEVAPGAPLLRIDRLTHDTAGRPVDYEQLYCRPDNFQYRLRIERR